MLEVVRDFPPAIWIRQTVGDTAAAAIGFVLAALGALLLASELRRVYLMRRQRRAYRRLTEHCNSCQTCQQLMDPEVRRRRRLLPCRPTTRIGVAAD